MGRFINGDAYTSTGQGVLGNDMFVYCGNNPVARYDKDGESWLVAGLIIAAIVGTINDIYQLAKEDSTVVPAYTTNKESVQIKDSYRIVTPWVQYGYSFYLNHYSEYNDYFTGTTIGMTYEWGLHNLGVAGFGALGTIKNMAGKNGDKMIAFSDRCKDVDIGPTIFHDNAETKGVFSHVMKGTFAIFFPFSAEHDISMHSLG